MGADRDRGGRRRPVRLVTYGVCGAVLLTGCASMPDGGDLRGVEASQRPDPQVRVFAMPPRENAQPEEIVQGFLEALTSDDPGFETARKYLTGEASKEWRPNQSTTVLADGPNTAAEHSGSREATGDYVYSLTGTRVAKVDSQFAYEPAAGTYNELVHLAKYKEKDGSRQWRIDELPQGLVMGKSDFQRNYLSVNKYYFASNTSGRSDDQLGAVADPVYVREQVDPVTQMVRSVLKGPTSWLKPVVRSSFPTGTALKKGVKTLAPDDQNRLTVPLNDKADRIGQSVCTEMAAQLLFTLEDLTPTGIDEVVLQRSDGTQSCALRASKAEIYVAHGPAKRAEYEYFIDGEKRLVRIASTGSEQEPEPVPGALGDGDKALRSAAVSRDEDTAAGVSLDGRSLYVGSLASGGSLGEPVLRSKAKSEDDGLTTPSWDASGDLWVADRDPKSSKLLLLTKGAGEPLVVTTPGLEGRIEAVRVAADGVRIALIVRKDDRTTLLLGRIERQNGSDGKPSVSIHELRSVAPQLEEVTAMSWAGDSRLVVVGREARVVQQIQYVQVDGSTPVGPAPAALTGVKEIAASEDERLPLVAHSEDGIVRLSSGSQWQTVVKTGMAPVYPG
ncbi:LpqB family beta-propeller domain-containing protein [Streptomyces phaeochromogenes]|uniref:Lipoprotein LpqB n=1 Tax=Streptomyces phaeochromogenes TaxID=1923 RepID=A0ABZ1HFL4_STRPH|nr:LpqB family beta-propeller domain-containing protein [Streptomyces phaeochromogenes]WRZ31870.1 LpqB family beta-propeller domain-containing protein [Streptomyces phaeochromogenes]WSD17401.1 LpqB family beta-propeller domain-containing protein [Streptomyces phaeochromogenes]WTA06351.1 LpqB family beta-propeller domain-containing protein [Streptomyces phaeochromogenes]